MRLFCVTSTHRARSVGSALIRSKLREIHCELESKFPTDSLHKFSFTDFSPFSIAVYKSQTVAGQPLPPFPNIYTEARPPNFIFPHHIIIRSLSIHSPCVTSQFSRNSNSFLMLGQHNHVCISFLEPD